MGDFTDMSRNRKLQTGTISRVGAIIANKAINKLAIPPGNPLTASGEHVMSSMKKTYGAKKGKSIFYASINKKKKGASKWHSKKK